MFSIAPENTIPAFEMARIYGYKLKRLIEEQPDEEFILWNGNRPQTKRKVFEQYIDEHMSVI